MHVHIITIARVGVGHPDYRTSAHQSGAAMAPYTDIKVPSVLPLQQLCNYVTTTYHNLFTSEHFSSCDIITLAIT